jgi:hypothetical protein
MASALKKSPTATTAQLSKIVLLTYIPANAPWSIRPVLPFSLRTAFLNALSPLPWPTPSSLTTPTLTAPPSLVLSFNFAVWRFRTQAQATPAVLRNNWLINKLVALASSLLAAAQAIAARKSHNSADTRKCAHADYLRAVASTPGGTVFAFTDGSASPNPGPCGAGAALFYPRDPDVEVTDLCAPLGWGTNNLAELYAIGMCLHFVSGRTPPPTQPPPFFRQSICHQRPHFKAHPDHLSRVNPRSSQTPLHHP